MDQDKKRRLTYKSHRRSYSAPITVVRPPLSSFNELQGNSSHIQSMSKNHPQDSQHRQGHSRWYQNVDRQRQDTSCQDQNARFEATNGDSSLLDNDSINDCRLLLQQKQQQSDQILAEEMSRHSDSGTEGSQNTAPMNDVLVLIELQPQKATDPSERHC